MNKRSFLRKTLLSAGAFAILPAISRTLKAFDHLPSEALASNDDFWAQIRADYDLKPDYINLENGYYNIMPRPVRDNYIERLKYVNLHGSYYMRTVQFENKKKISDRLAALLNCQPDELIITRNTTESLDMIISGQNWQSGDEAVMAFQDYGAMRDMFFQVSKRFGVIVKEVDIPLHPANDQEILDIYANAISPKTKLLMVCHMINITGQILPIQKICEMAHAKGVAVMVDGAHAVAHLNLSIEALGCDYYGASLHKWLSAPLGTGMLYVKKERIPDVWPLFAEANLDSDNIARLNHTGTIPVHSDLAILDAIDYYEKIGARKKEDRLRFLQKYWTEQVRNLPNILLNTPAESHRACAIANVGVKGISPAELAQTLLEKYGIYTVAIDGAGVMGCRITPNVFTTTEELDKLVKALTELSKF